MTKKGMTYQQAIFELEQIVGQIERNELGIDELATQVKKASQLVQFCKEKLQQTDTEIEKILQEIQA